MLTNERLKKMIATADGDQEKLELANEVLLLRDLLDSYSTGGYPQAVPIQPTASDKNGA